MPKRPKRKAGFVARLFHYGAVIAADLAQIEADARTHPDQDASRRILFAVDRLRQIAQADVTPALADRLRAVADVLNE